MRALVTARQQLADLREQVAQAEREDVRLYSAALADGWTTDELRRLGLGEPEKKARVRRRAAQKRTAGAAVKDGTGNGGHDVALTPPSTADDSPNGEQR